jgi:hypothetical protein
MARALRGTDPRAKIPYWLATDDKNEEATDDYEVLGVHQIPAAKIDRIRISTERNLTDCTMFRWSVPRAPRAPRESDIGHLQKRGTTMAANNKDAALVIQILRWGAEIGLDEATHEIFAEGFDPEFATADDKAVRTMLVFGETVATLVKHKTLDKDLVEDLWWVDGAWARVGSAAKKARERLGEPRLYENFEALATG